MRNLIRKRPALLLLSSFGLALFLAVAVVLAPALTRAQQDERGFLANLISRALSQPGMIVSVGEIDGALSSNATIRDITVADRDGVWLSIAEAKLVWTRSALLFRRLEIDELSVTRIDVARRPIADPTVAPLPADADQPILPELPVKVVVKAFGLQEMRLGEALLGVAARIGASGRATLGNPNEGLDLSLDIDRHDRPGQIAVKLLFVPQTNALDLVIQAKEPEEGLIARLAALPGLPPVDLDVAGNGTLDNFAARIAFAAGQGIGANGGVTLQRQGAERNLALDLRARIAGLLPPLVAPIFGGETVLTGHVGFADTGALALRDLSIAAAAARLDASGAMAADGALDIRAGVRALPGADGIARAGEVQLRNFSVDAAVTGSTQRPLVHATLDLDDARLPAGRFGKAQARLEATPSGPLADAATRIALIADASASGIALTDPALASAVGTQARFALRGSLTTAGEGQYEIVEIDAPSLQARFTGALGPERVDGRAEIAAADLSRFAALAGSPLRGRAQMTAALTGALKRDVAARLDGALTQFSTGIAQADSLLGNNVTLTGTASLLQGGGYGFDDLRLAGAHANATLNGALRQWSSDATARIELPRLERLDNRLTGRASVDARITQSIESPDVALTATLADASAMKRAIPRLTLEARLRDVARMIAADVKLDGLVDGRAATGNVSLAKLTGGGWRVDPLDIVIGSASVKGDVTLDAANRAAGTIVIAAPDLDDLSVLALQELQGRLNARFDFTLTEGRQDIAFEAAASGVSAASIRLDRLDANGTLRDLYGMPSADATIAADRIVIAGQDITSLRANAVSRPEGTELTLNANAAGFALSGAGLLAARQPLTLDLARFEARRGNRRIALAQPTQLTFADGGVAFANLVAQVDRGRITLDGRAGETLDLSVGIRTLPLSAAEIFAPGIGITGTLEGEARITGTAAAPSGDYRIRASRISAPQTRQQNLPALDAQLSGTLSGGRASLAGTISGGRAIALRLDGSVPLAATGALDLGVSGTLDAALANAQLSLSGQRATGRLALDMRIGGTIAAPQIGGAATLANGSFTDSTNGVALSAINARITGRGDEIAIERLTAATRNGGTVNASGNVRVDPAAGFPGTIRIAGNRAQLVSSDLAQLVANLDLTLSGPLAQSPRIAGNINVVSLDISVPDRLPITLRPLPDTRHVRPTPTARERLAIAARAAREARRTPAFNALLDLSIDAPNRIFVRGRGIDAELGGNLRLTGSTSAPVAIGAFELRRGRITVLAQRIDFTRGRLFFAGDLVPELDFVAETQAGDVTAQVVVSGPANQPNFSFQSQPDLPQDEVLSRLLFQKASGGLSAVQALQLAAAVAQFSGEGGGLDVFENLRKGLGVDSLDIQTSGSGTSVGASRYISDRASIGVRAGATPETSAVSIGIDLTRRLKITGEVTGAGGTAVGIGAEWEY